MEPTTKNTQKVDPKLRMISNGDLEVNTMRSERCDSIAVTSGAELDTPSMLGMNAVSANASEVYFEARKQMDEPPKEVRASVFIQLSDNVQNIPEIILRSAGSMPPIRRGNLVYAALPLNTVADVAESPDVIAIEQTERIAFSLPINVAPVTDGPPEGWLRAPGLAGDAGNGGAGVLVGIVDVQGFDFSHPDFLDSSGNTRFLAIWDQAGTSHPSPEGFGYGSELLQADMNAALESARKGGLPATLLEPQSQMVPGSHGTHVTSIAAGNRGVSPKADIAAVLISLPIEDQDRRKSFYDSSRITQAVDYLFSLGKKLNRPVSINISLGTNGHAHDGSSITSRWIDFALTTPGRSVTVAAGNAGQEKATQVGDWGYIMGRIHNSGQVPQDGSVDIEWVVIGDGIADLSENEMEIWYSSQDHFGIQIRPPLGDWSEIIEPGEFIENRDLSVPRPAVPAAAAAGPAAAPAAPASPAVPAAAPAAPANPADPAAAPAAPANTPTLVKNFLSIYNEYYSPANGANYIACYLSPFLKAPPIGIIPGTWLVRLHGRTIRDGSYHAWIERDDPRKMGSLGLLQAWSFPSFLSECSNVDNTSVSSMACGQNIIAVANLDEAKSIINITSSQGPTRDGRDKPDVAAPGTDILAACGFSVDSNWIRMSGTSMSAPFVTGVIAQMLSTRPDLTSAQICAILNHTARPLPEQGFKWANDAGFGMIDPAECIQEVKRTMDRKDRTK